MSYGKRPFTAGVLNFFLPGLGLLYLGYKKAALINFLLVNLVLFVLIVLVADPTLIEHVHYVFLGLAALSAGYAHGVATTDRKRAEQDSSQGTNHSIPV